MKDFPFEYVGGGYFRDKTIPKGTSAPTLHGMQIVELIIENLDCDTKERVLQSVYEATEELRLAERVRKS